jgi:carbon starvation protein
MFEALFILTTLDAGTRVGRFMLQDLGQHIWEPFGRVSWYPAVLMSSAMMVGMWGYFLYQGVIDPLGGINSLWPLFGISNQLLATVALCVGTTIIIKMGKAKYAYVTILPLIWLTIICMAAGWEKIFSDEAAIGFLKHASVVKDQIATGTLPAAIKSVADARRVIMNDYIDAGVAAFFMLSTIVILGASIGEWYKVLFGGKEVVSSEVPFAGALSSGD